MGLRHRSAVVLGRTRHLSLDAHERGQEGGTRGEVSQTRLQPTARRRAVTLLFAHRNDLAQTVTTVAADLLASVGKSENRRQ